MRLNPAQVRKLRLFPFHYPNNVNSTKGKWLEVFLEGKDIIKIRYSGEEFLKGVEPELEKNGRERERRKYGYKRRSRTRIQRFINSL